MARGRHPPQFRDPGEPPLPGGGPRRFHAVWAAAEFPRVITPALIVLLALALVLPALPRRYVPLAFLLGSILIPPTAFVPVGSLHFYPQRVLVVSGLVRMWLKSERPSFFPQRLDKIMLGFGFVCVASSVCHKPVGDALVYRCAVALDWVGTYFLFRTWIQGPDDVRLYLRSVMIVLIPFAITMLAEKATGHNVFAHFASMRAESPEREGHVRASGPFVNYIDAGTTGAVFLALALSLRGQSRGLGRVGAASCLAIAFASWSSSPLVTCIVEFVALWLWRYRDRLRAIIWGCLGAMLFLQLFKNRPIWFLMADVDFVGGSTGWYRAMLISRALEHLNEWWLGGSDYTRHWMATGTHADPNMADLVNHYIWVGVIGGLPTLIMFVWTLRECFRQISIASRDLPEAAVDLRYTLWCLGSSLFAMCVTFFSMSFYCETSVCLYSLVAVIGSACPAVAAASSDEAALDATQREPEPSEAGGIAGPVAAARGFGG